MIDEYMEEASRFAIYPGKGTGTKTEFSYLGLGLAGETGEVVEKIKKLIRDHPGEFPEDKFCQEMAKELGDVLWYVSQLCLAIEIPMSVVLKKNLEKLADRANRHVLHGSGDNR